MKPTMHLRFDKRVTWEGDVVQPIHRNILQQFWEIGAEESDITLPRDIGPNGETGRWRDVPLVG